MDFKYCYKKNSYKEDLAKLPNDWKAFIAGFLYAISVLETACDNFESSKSIEDDELPHLAKLKMNFFKPIQNICCIG